MSLALFIYVFAFTAGTFAVVVGTLHIASSISTGEYASTLLGAALILLGLVVILGVVR